MSVDLGAIGADRPFTLGGFHPALSKSQAAALQLFEAILALKVAAHFLCLLEVVVGSRFRTVLAHERHGDMYVVIAVRGEPMAHRDPPAGGLSACLGEAHPVSEVLRDHAPLLIRQLSLFGTQRERAMPHVARDP